MLSQFITPTPIRGSMLVPQGLPKDISWCMVSISVCFLLTLNATLIEHKKTEGHVDQTDMDFDEVDAQIVLEIARTHRIICHLEHELAETQCAEGQGLIKLYKHQAEDVKKQQDYAEFDLGLVQDMVTSNFSSSELLIMCKPNTKHPACPAQANISIVSI